MDKKLYYILLSLILIMVFFSSCIAMPEERLHSSESVVPDEILDNVWPSTELVNYIPEAGGDKILSVERKNNELIITIAGTLYDRVQFENDLYNNWFFEQELKPGMNDRISTWLHPSGWRIAIYDSKRTKELKKLNEGYVYRIFVKRIEYNRSDFPEFPDANRSLGLDDVSYDNRPDSMLPDDFPPLPEHAESVSYFQKDIGVFITYEISRKYHNEIYNTFHNAGYVGWNIMHNKNGDYCYVSVAADIADVNNKDTVFYHVTLQSVRRDFLPDFWRSLDEKD